jgi:hypothetical protein
MPSYSTFEDLEAAAPVFAPDGSPCKRTFEDYLGADDKLSTELVIDALAVDTVGLAVENDIVPGGERDWSCSFYAFVGGIRTDLCFWWCATYDPASIEPFKGFLAKLAAGETTPVHHTLAGKHGAGEFALTIDYDGKGDTVQITRVVCSKLTTIGMPAKLLRGFLHLVAFGLTLQM